MHFTDDPMTLECTLPYPKTLDKNILAIRARETQEVVPENGVHENIVDVTASSHMMQVTDSVVGMEATPLDLQHSTERNGMSNHGDSTQTEAVEEEELALPANKEDKVMDEQHGGSGGSSSLASPAAGRNEVGGQVQQKKRKKRAKNWTAEETDVLLLQVGGTCSGMLSQDQWKTISQAVHGRTWEECQDRMDTLKKSYNLIKKYCNTNEKEFEELQENDFQAMEPKQSVDWRSRGWYNRIRNHCPPISKRKSRSETIAESVPRPGKISRISASCILTLGNTLGEHGLQHPDAGPSNVGATTPGGIESAVAAFESTAHVTGTRSALLTEQDPPQLLPVWDQDPLVDADWDLAADWTEDLPALPDDSFEDSMDDSFPDGWDWNVAALTP